MLGCSNPVSGYAAQNWTRVDHAMFKLCVDHEGPPVSPPERGTNFTLRQNRATQSQKLCCRVHLVSLVLEKEKIVIVNSSMPSGIICFARSPLPILSSHCAELYLVLPKIIHRMNKVACRCCNERCLECQTSCVHAMRKESRLCRVNQARMRAHVVVFAITSRKHFMCSPLWEKTATDEGANFARSPRFMPMISVLLGFEDTSIP